jgi:hypothetical protein
MLCTTALNSVQETVVCCTKHKQDRKLWSIDYPKAGVNKTGHSYTFESKILIQKSLSNAETLILNADFLDISSRKTYNVGSAIRLSVEGGRLKHERRRFGAEMTA